MANLKDILTSFVKNYLKKEELYLKLCTVISVDESKFEFTVKTNDSAPDIIVKMTAIGSNLDSFFIVPKIDSAVLIGFINKTAPYCLSVQNAEKIISNCDSIIFNGGENFGIVKVKELTTKLNNLENKLNNFLNSTYNLHTHVCAAPASPSAVPIPLNSGILTPTLQNDIENTKIKH